MAEKIKMSGQGYRLEYRMGTRWNEKSMGWYIDCKSCGEQLFVLFVYTIGSVSISGWRSISRNIGTYLNSLDYDMVFIDNRLIDSEARYFIVGPIPTMVMTLCRRFNELRHD
jgi:hypothetical protein